MCVWVREKHSVYLLIPIKLFNPYEWEKDNIYSYYGKKMVNS